MREARPEPFRFAFPGMALRAAEVLSRNDAGSWTKASPGLYPHQWSWDSAFITIGLAHLDCRRAARELETLFASQWRNGKVPHIVFNPEAPASNYPLGLDHWASHAYAPDAPVGSPLTSGLCQPAVHAIAALRIFETACEEGRREEWEARAFLCGIYPKLLAWHRYLMSFRDPEDSGLVTIYHPWESGTDNSPRWQMALEAVEVGDLPPYERIDLAYVDDPSERPSKEEYDRYLWLLELLRRARYDESEIYGAHPFLVKDVLFSSILVAANEALLEINRVVGATDEAEIEAWISRGRNGIDSCWDDSLGLCPDYDIRGGRCLRVRTVAGFAPLIAGGLGSERQRALVERLFSPDFAGDTRLKWPLPPSTSPVEKEFHPRSYWRGPVWPVISWLLWWSLVRAGEGEHAARLRRASLEQLAADGFAEYFEPFTGEALGSGDQSWTAAVVLDWLAASG